ncbi:MAG: VOC family protein [Gemmatimonadaceae bacterium]|nr:VOC family protein [Acetobacteraceae bacterium]
MPLDHVGISVTDFARSRAFYVGAFEPLGIPLSKEGETWALMGADGGTALWFGVDGQVPSRIHIAYMAATRAQVHAFHAAALAAGGRDNGGPGLRPQYGPNYYAAFVLDPDGHNIEAVCHDPAG